MVAEHLKRIAEMDREVTQYFNDKNAYHEANEQALREEREEQTARRKRIASSDSKTKRVQEMKRLYAKKDNQRILDELNVRAYRVDYRTDRQPVPG